MFSVLFFGLWYAAAAAKLAAALRMLLNGMAHRFPLVTALLLTSGVRSVVLAQYFKQPARYQILLAGSESFALLLEGAALVSVYFVLTEHYPKFRKPGLILLGVLAFAGVMASVLSSSWGVNDWQAIWGANVFALLARRYASLAMATILLGVRLLLPRIGGIPIRPSAARAAWILGLQVSAALAISSISLWTGPTLFGYFAPLVSGFGVALAWFFAMTPASDRCGELVPVSAEESAEYARALNDIEPGVGVYIRLRMALALRSNTLVMWASSSAGSEGRDQRRR